MHNIGSINNKNGISINYLSWDNKLILYLLDKFKFIFRTALLCLFRHVCPSQAYAVRAPGARHVWRPEMSLT